MDNGKLRVVNRQFKTECEDQRAPLVAYKEGPVFSGKTGKAQNSGCDT